MKDIRNLILLILFFAITLSVPAWSQEDVSVDYANSITSGDLRGHLEILASDALEGRETGERGQKMAAAYIEHHFLTNGLTAAVPTAEGKSYIQRFNLWRISQGQAWIKINENTSEHGRDFVYTGKRNFTQPERSRIVFAGAGNAADFEAISVEGKNVMLLVDGDRAMRNEKAAMAFDKGAKNVFIIYPGSEAEFATILSRYKRFATGSMLTLAPETEDDGDQGYFLISSTMGAEIMNTNATSLKQAVEKSNEGKYNNLLKLQSKEIGFYAHQNIEEVSTENVLGFVEGSDKKDEFVVISAHYDHIGITNGEVNNGADDDGSGTVAVMEMAQAFALAKEAGHGPRRSVLFLTVTGEEKGLLGSTYYVNHPVVPLQNTVTDLNIDMIGRVDKDHEQNRNYVYLIGSDKLSKSLHEVSEQVNTTYTDLELDYKFNDEKDPNRFYYRSDHYNFAKNNIPVIFYFNGVHDDYHRPTDDIEKIDFDLMEKRTKLVFHTAWEIANRDERIRVDVFPGDLPLPESK
ncbi:MAG: M28 family peptidase [Cyclobacteriaceae bacterium]|nr:M28 family peptidase [Cyclobacteriaceae bacterium]